MKYSIGIFSLLLLSQTAFAEESQTQAIEAKPVEAQIIESETDAISQSAEQPTSTQNQVMMEEQSGFSRGSVVRSAFTREVEEREPTENLQKLTNENGEVKFFTELRDMNGQTATHRWEYDGKVVAEISFDVKGPRWRVWSSKSLVPQWTGDWKVSVVNGAGEVISEKKFSYDVAAAPESSPESTATEATPAANSEVSPAMNAPTSEHNNMQ